MRFTKMQANGNDYIYIELFEQFLPDPAGAAVRLSDRRTGVGGDGLVLLCPCAFADFRMRIFDPDGTEAEMCGNALMSAGALFARSGRTRKDRLGFGRCSSVRSARTGLRCPPESGRRACGFPGGRRSFAGGRCA